MTTTTQTKRNDYRRDFNNLNDEQLLKTITRLERLLNADAHFTGSTSNLAKLNYATDLAKKRGII